MRLVVSLEGELRAQVKDEGRAIELKDGDGKRALSYSKLTALDADGKQLAAHMEARADGSEIALVVDDRGATYPIVIDPIVASLEKILYAESFAETGAQFGDAVAIDGNRAIVGEWLHDSDAQSPDGGAVFFFVRVGTTWSLLALNFFSAAFEIYYRVSSIADAGAVCRHAEYKLWRRVVAG